jgi:hypothetical protein
MIMNFGLFFKRTFESRVLRRIFGPKVEDVKRGWKMYNEKI